MWHTSFHNENAGLCLFIEVTQEVDMTKKQMCNTGNFQGYHEMKLVWVKNPLNGNNAFLKAILKCKLSFVRRSCNEIFSIASVLPCAQFRHLSKRMGSIVAQLVIVSTKKQFDLQPVHF